MRSARIWLAGLLAAGLSGCATTYYEAPYDPYRAYHYYEPYPFYGGLFFYHQHSVPRIRHYHVDRHGHNGPHVRDGKPRGRGQDAHPPGAQRDHDGRDRGTRWRGGRDRDEADAGRGPQRRSEGERRWSRDERRWGGADRGTRRSFDGSRGFGAGMRSGGRGSR